MFFSKPYFEAIRFLSNGVLAHGVAGEAKTRTNKIIQKIRKVGNKNGTVYFSQCPTDSGAFLLFLAGLTNKFKKIKPVFIGKNTQIVCCN